MKQSMSRMIALSLAILLVFSLAACGGAATTTTSTTKTPATANGTTTAATTAAPKAPVTITSLHSEGTVPSQNPSILEEVRKLTNINWQPVLVGPADYETKLNSMIAAKQLPDIFSFTYVKGEDYVANGMLTQLDSLLATYGAEILANRKAYMGTGLNTSSKTWGIPTPAGYQDALAIRSDWLKNLNLEVPDTLDEFYNVLKAFTQNDPDKDGKADTIGMASSILYVYMWEPLFGAFGIPYKTPVMVDGVVTSYLLHPKFLDAVQYIRKLYQEGLMEPDFATIPQMSCLEKLWNGTYGAMGFNPVGTTNNWMPGRYTETPTPTFVYTVIKGADGAGGFNEVRSSNYYGIASTCKYPEEAMKLCNFLGSKDGDELIYFGIEGKHFKWTDEANGKYEYIAPYTDSATQRADGGYIFWSMFRRWDDNAEIRTLTSISRDALALSKKNTLKDAYIFATPAVQKDSGTTLSDIETEALTNLIVSKGDIKAEYAAYVQRWLSEGGKTWQEQATVIYNKEHK